MTGYDILPRRNALERDRPAGRSPPAREPLRVLLIEDEADAADLVQVYLTEQRENRFQIEWIPDLLDAMFRLQYGGVDVVLLDLGLPERDGDKSFRAITE